MSNLGIFFGSDTGNTEKVAKMIQKKFKLNSSDFFNISQSRKQDLENYSKLILGIPTWYYGEAQCDWNDFLPTLSKIDFSDKTVALFGCGDQCDYSEYFCDAMSIIKNIIKKNGATMIGHWSSSGYQFEASKSLINDNYFIGLAIDEDCQPELTNQRIEVWSNQIFKEMSSF